MRKVTLLLALAAVASFASNAMVGSSKYGCDNCHTLPAQRTHTDSGCVGCHQSVRRRAAGMLGRRPEVEHLLTTPSLVNVTRRLETEYLVRYLQDPHDVRHRLDESMPLSAVPVFGDAVALSDSSLMAAQTWHVAADGSISAGQVSVVDGATGAVIEILPGPCSLDWDS